MGVRVLLVLRKVNLIYLVCDHLVGEDHTNRHRMGVGVVVMAIGVTVANCATFFQYEIVRGILDGVGYLIHGIGSIPYAETLVAIASTKRS